MKIRQSKQTGAVAVEYMILLAFFAVFLMSNADDLEDVISDLEDKLTADINALVTAVDSHSHTTEDNPAAGGG